MKLSEFIEQLQFLAGTLHHDPEVVVPITSTIPTVGGSACLPITQLGCGFDWDHNKFFLWPQEGVCKHTETQEAFAKQIRKDVDNVHYQYMSAQRENKLLRKKLAEYEKQPPNE